MLLDKRLYHSSLGARPLDYVVIRHFRTSCERLERFPSLMGPYYRIVHEDADHSIAILWAVVVEVSLTYQVIPPTLTNRDTYYLTHPQGHVLIINANSKRCQFISFSQ